VNEGYVCHINEQIDGAVYVGRVNGRKKLNASLFANPFVIGYQGDRATVIDKYRNYLRVLIWGGYHHEEFIALRGKPLACWCRKSTAKSPACHGDVILELLNQYTDDDIRAFEGVRAFKEAS
jgi:hypothetical protein